MCFVSTHCELIKNDNDDSFWNTFFSLIEPVTFQLKANEREKRFVIGRAKCRNMQMERQICDNLAVCHLKYFDWI